APGPLSSARAKHSKSPVTTPPSCSAWNANVVKTGIKPPVAPVPPSMMVVPAPRAIVVDGGLWPCTNGANKLVANTSPSSDPASQSPEDVKNNPLDMFVLLIFGGCTLLK